MTPRFTLRRFLRCERGAQNIEAVVMFPALILFFLITFTFYDAYRTQTVVTKSGYVMGDLLSRETGTLDTTDLDGMRDVFSYLTFTQGDGTQIRVSEVTRRVDVVNGIDEYMICWSHGTGTLVDLLDTDLPQIIGRIPVLTPNERITVLETFTPYRPPFKVGISPFVMESFVVTRQRYAGQLRFGGGGRTVSPGCT
ncbi:hypothetical protein [Jannaschia sp. LMIT008]|uniref:TadE/TadG family type IV pilus assembly protein n=1 Tax=Jannaschia maritima TaxID=3032585 RepID=UPI002810EAE1|nr:hypothetical protein [Jannaschia sp. LMIT008]